MGERERDPTMASRGACQWQLKPPGGTTRSNIGVVESWLASSCCTRPISGLGNMVPPAKWLRAAGGETPELQHSPARIWWHLGIQFAGTGRGHQPLRYRGSLGVRRSGGRGGNAAQFNHPPPSTHRPRTLVRIQGTDTRSMCPHMRETQGGGGFTRDGYTTWGQTTWVGRKEGSVRRFGCGRRSQRLCPPRHTNSTDTTPMSTSRYHTDTTLMLTFSMTTSRCDIVLI